MLTKLRVKNFKAWGEELWDEGVELAPITLFLGPNSAGKTSLLQVPLLLKQTFTSPDPSLDLNLGGQPTDLIDVGTYESLVHGNDKNRRLGIGISVAFPSRGAEKHLNYAATFMASGLAAALEELSFEFNGRTVVAKRLDDEYRLEVPSEGAMLGFFQQSRASAFEFKDVPEVEGLPDFASLLKTEDPKKFWKYLDFQIQLASFRRRIEKIGFLGPLRDEPSRSYLWSGARPVDLGSRGERSVAALLASLDEAEEGKSSSLVENVSRWMKTIGIADELVIERHGRSRYNELYVVEGGRKTNIIDVGFGISQVLPMLVLSYFVEEGTTIIAEQPELHLHPRAQVGLAELMVEVARERKVQFIVETHSEHLFRRLQTLISEEKLSHEECRLYFVDRNDEGKTQLTTLEVDPFGRVKNWPKHFFGDAIGETERQTRKMMERLARERSKR